MITSNITMGKKHDLWTFICDMVVGLSISQTAELLGFSHIQQVPEFTQNGQYNEFTKHSFVGGNALLIREVGGKWPE